MTAKKPFRHVLQAPKIHFKDINNVERQQGTGERAHYLDDGKEGVGACRDSNP